MPKSQGRPRYRPWGCLLTASLIIGRPARKRPKYDREIRVRGFTLLEVLVSILILVTVLSTVFASYTGTFRIVSETEMQGRIYEMARIAFERILEDLESCYLPVDFTPSEGEEEAKLYVFEGKDEDINGESADTLYFSSRAHLTFRGEDDPSGEIATIGYYVGEKEDADGLILFRSDRVQQEDASEEKEGGIPLCENLAFVDFKYVDLEDEEHDGWDPDDGIPRMVSITLGFNNPSDPQKPYKFGTKVALTIRLPEKGAE